MSIKKMFLFVSTLVFTITVVSCSSFVKEENMPALKKLESNTYVLKKDVEIGSGSVKKGRSVKVVIMAGDDWLKVYTYSAKGDKLKAPRTLILYMFEDEFKKETYSYKYFEKRFFEILEIKAGK